MSAINFLLGNQRLIAGLTLQHVILTGCALAIAGLIGIAAGITGSRVPRFGTLSLTIANVGQSIPSIALIGLVVPLLGIGFWPALVALAVRGVLPIYMNTYLGLAGVPAATREAAVGNGLGNRQILIWVEIPIAAPIIMAGIRTAAVEGVAVTTLAAFIGGGGLGDLILQGIAMMDPARLMGGALPVAALAIVAELVFGAVEFVLRRNFNV